MDSPKVDTTLAHMDQQEDVRLHGLEVGSGAMDAPDTSGYQTELQQMSDEQREIRLLALKQQRADMAMKLWSTLYDPRRENAAAAGDAPAQQKTQPAVVSTPTAASAAAAAAAAAAQAGLSAMLPLPKTVSISGGRYSADGQVQSLHAVLLVPYSGEVEAKVGTELPGNRKVVSITPDGVYVSDPKLGRVVLGYGDTVPLTPPVVAVAPAPAPAPGVPGTSTGNIP